MTFEKSISFHLAAKGFWLLLHVASFTSILISHLKNKKGFNYGPLPPSHTIALYLQFSCQINFKIYNRKGKYLACNYYVNCQESYLTIDQYLWVKIERVVNRFAGPHTRNKAQCKSWWSLPNLKGNYSSKQTFTMFSLWNQELFSWYTYQ